MIDGRNTNNDGQVHTGEIAIRPMGIEDITAGLELKALAGWNQTPADWAMLLRETPDDCFVAVHNGRIVGTIATLRYPASPPLRELGWLGMVLVHPEFRGQGIGQKLLRHALAKAQDCSTLQLDATSAGKPLYEKFGFQSTSRVLRCTHRSVPHLQDDNTPEGLRPLENHQLDEAVALDTLAIGANRQGMLEFLATHPESAWGLRAHGALQGFCLGRPGANFWQVGPVIAPSTAQACTLLSAAFQALAGLPVVVDVAGDKAELVQWLQSLGFVHERDFDRMTRGPRPETPRGHELHVIAGPELG